MRLKGLIKFREKIPWFSGKKILILPIYFILVFIASILVMIWFDSVPGRVISSQVNLIGLALSPLIGELVIATIGFLLVYQMWFWREKLKAKYGQLSYQRIFLVGFTGVLCVLSLGINLYIPFWLFSPSFWMQSPLQLLVQPIEFFIPLAGPIIFWIRMVFAVFFLIMGIGMAVRSLQIFGFDYMTVVYLYFPEESQLQEHEIYSVLRHPAYSGAIAVGLGGVFFNFTIYSIILIIVLIIGFYFHIYFVEEKELLLRFGKSFQEYRKEVPAFFVKPGKVGVLLSFLLK